MIGALQNIVNCAEDDSEIWVDTWPEVQAVFIFPSGGEHGVPAIENERRLFATNAESARYLLEKLNPLDGSGKIVFRGVRELLWPVVEEFAKSVSYRTETETVLCPLYLPDTAPLPGNLQLPDGFSVGCLQPKHGATLNSVYSHNVGIDGEVYMTGLIKSFPSVAVYEQVSGNLAAWVICKENGAIGNLYVCAPYRRRGLASFVVTQLARIRRRMGYVPFLAIEHHKTISLELHKKLGFIEAEESLQTIVCVRD